MVFQHQQSGKKTSTPPILVFKTDHPPYQIRTVQALPLTGLQLCKLLNPRTDELWICHSPACTWTSYPVASNATPYRAMPWHPLLSHPMPCCLVPPIPSHLTVCLQSQHLTLKLLLLFPTPLPTHCNKAEQFSAQIQQSIFPDDFCVYYWLCISG